MFDSFLHGDHATAPTDFSVVGLAVLLSFLLGQLIAWVYMATHSGLSYSRAFVVSLLLLPVLVAIVMMVLANSLVAAVGVMAVFAIVRFRNVVRDTLDTAHVLAAIVLGMACGLQKFTTAIFGGAVVAAIVLYAWITAFGRRRPHDYLLQLHWNRPLGELPELTVFLDRHCRRCVCAHRKQSADGRTADLAYTLQLRDPDRADELLRELSAVPGTSEITGIPAGDESEP